MAGAVFYNVEISGLAGAVPKQVINNREYDSIFGKDIVDRFIDLTGVERLHRAQRQQTAGDLGFIAAEKLLSELSVDRSQVGTLVFISESPDYIWPSTAYVIHHRLGLSDTCMAFDTNLGCSGFVYGIHMCASLLQSMKEKYALLITGEADKFQNILDRENPDTANVMMFGDACTALLLKRTQEASPIRTALYGDGSGYRMMIRGGMCRSVDVSSKATRWSDGLDRSITDPYMDGMGVFGFSTRTVPKSIAAFIAEGNESLSEYKAVYFHQANKMIVDRIARKLGLESAKVPLSLEKYGNTSSATIPVTIIDRLGDDTSCEPQKVLLCGFGVGLSWGIVSIHISPSCVLPMLQSDDFFADGELNPF